MSISLPVITLATPGQRYSCHGCGHCCRDFTVQLREADRERLDRQGWAARLGFDPTIKLRGQHYLRQREDGSCIFLKPDGKCQIHAEFGFEAKPIACRFFPYMFSPATTSVRMGISFACQSVVENKGLAYNTQAGEAQRMARDIPEALVPAGLAHLARKRPAEAGELEGLERGLVQWISGPESLSTRLDGLAWLATTLAAAKLDRVRGSRFVELVDTLVTHLADELPHHPVALAEPRELMLLRTAVFARVEDPKLAIGGRLGRWAVAFDQGCRYWRWRGENASWTVPPVRGIDGIAVTFVTVESVKGVTQSPELAECDELLTRWMRATIEGGRVWGSGYYGWSAIDGLLSLSLSTACVGWVARLSAAKAGRGVPNLSDVRVAVRRIDRSAGRAPWLGGKEERVRLAWFQRYGDLRRVLAEQY